MAIHESHPDHSRRKEFEAFAAILAPHGFMDSSWRHDVSPSMYHESGLLIHFPESESLDPECIGMTGKEYCLSHPDSDQYWQYDNALDALTFACAWADMGGYLKQWDAVQAALERVHPRLNPRGWAGSPKPAFLGAAFSDLALLAWAGWAEKDSAGWWIPTSKYPLSSPC